MNRSHQFALSKARQASVKSIFVEMYQKQAIVINIFRDSSTTFLKVDLGAGEGMGFINSFP